MAINLILFPVGFLAGDQPLKIQIGNAHAFNDRCQRVSDCLLIGDLPCADADVYLHLVGYFDNDVIQQVAWSEFRRRVVFKLR